MYIHIYIYIYTVPKLCQIIMLDSNKDIILVDYPYYCYYYHYYYYYYDRIIIIIIIIISLRLYRVALCCRVDHVSRVGVVY